MTYVSVDLDWPSKLEITIAWIRVAKHTTDGPYGRISASGHGIHIKSHRVLPDPVPVAETERIHAGDDMNRLEADMKFDAAPNQLLWDKKDGQKPGEWADDMDYLIAEYRMETQLTPTQYEIKHV